jgi:hypothetical protein
VLLPGGDTGWWHDRDDGPWGTHILREVIPAALERRGQRPSRDRRDLSMGGLGALDLGRLAPDKFCVVGGHSPAVCKRLSDDSCSRSCGLAVLDQRLR